MWNNYFKIAWRNLLAKKFYAFINILGLSIGLTCCMLIFLYVQHELSYDTFHTKSDRIYRLVTDVITPTETINAAITSAPMAINLEKEFPEVEAAVRVHYDIANVLLERNEVQFYESEGISADVAFFEVFDFPLLRGNPATALKDPFSIVLTENAAKKYFGDQDPIGQRLIMDGEHNLTVTGIAGNPPLNSQIQFTYLISMTTFTEKLFSGIDEQWGNFGFYTFLLLTEGSNFTNLNEKFPDFLEQHVGPAMKEMNMRYSMFLEPYTSVYLESVRESPVTGNKSNIYIFSIVAAFTLIIAGFNFMNLTTARATERAKEVGIRKVIGAIRHQLTFQFITEAILMSLFAFIIAVLLSQLFLPAFNHLSGKVITQNIFELPFNLLLFFLLSLVVGILAGIYPAFVLSSFVPVTVLKGRFSGIGHGLWLRKSLVVVQFAISIMLIAGTVIVYTQLEFMRNQALGFKKEQMLVIDYKGDEKVNRQLESIKNTILKNASVLSVSASSSTPSGGNSVAYTNIENRDGEMQAANVDLYSVDFDFFDQYQINLVAGRAFSRDFPADSINSLIINEATVSSYGFLSPEDALGKRFSQWGREGHIIGVIKNFHLRSLQEEIKPLTLRIQPSDFRYLAINIATDDIPGTIAGLEQQWKEVVTDRPFEYFFLDDAFDNQYRDEVRFGNLFIYAAGLTIFIACLGLLGLVSYTVVQRTKEIGIRKVLGASEGSIVGLLSKEFVALVCIAFIIATPIAWWAMNHWLEKFAYNIDLEWWMFLVAGMVAAGIAIFTISLQSINAAMMNPVNSLRSE